MKLDSRSALPPKLLAALAAAVLLDGLALWLILAQDPAIAPAWSAGALGLHLAGAAAVWAVGRGGNAGADAAYLSGLSGLLVFFLPVVGPAGCLLSLTVGRGVLQSRGLAQAFSGQSAMDGLQGSGVLSLREVELNEELSTQPVVDILEGDDPALKRGAIQLLRRLGTPDAVRLLKKSLSDESPEARFYAHTALSRLEEDFANRLAQAHERLSDQDPASLVHLARVQRQYADSGLPDESIRVQTFEDARANMRRALELQDPDQRMRVEMGQLELRLGDLEAAAGRFTSVLRAEPDNADAMLGLLETRFAQRDVTGLQRLREAMAGRRFDTTDPHKLVVLNFWAGNLNRESSHA